MYNIRRAYLSRTVPDKTISCPGKSLPEASPAALLYTAWISAELCDGAVKCCAIPVAAGC